MTTSATAASSAHLIVVTATSAAMMLVTTASVVRLLWRWSCTTSHHIVWIIHVGPSVRIVTIRLHALHLWIDLHGRGTTSVHLTAAATEASTTATAVVVAATIRWWPTVL